MIALIFIVSEALSQTMLCSSGPLCTDEFTGDTDIETIYLELYTEKSFILQFTFSEMFCTRAEKDRNICLWSNGAAKAEIIFRAFCSFLEASRLERGRMCC